MCSYCAKHNKLADAELRVRKIVQHYVLVAALELILAASASVVALAKNMAKPDTKTATRTISIPKTKVIKQLAQQPRKPTADDTVRTAIKPIFPQKAVIQFTNKLIPNKYVHKQICIFLLFLF